MFVGVHCLCGCVIVGGCKRDIVDGTVEWLRLCGQPSDALRDIVGHVHTVVERAAGRETVDVRDVCETIEWARVGRKSEQHTHMASHPPRASDKYTRHRIIPSTQDTKEIADECECMCMYVWVCVRVR